MKKLKAKHSFGNAETTSPRSGGLGGLFPFGSLGGLSFGLALSLLFALMASCSSTDTLGEQQADKATVSVSLSTRSGDGTADAEQPWQQGDAIAITQESTAATSGWAEMATLKYCASEAKWTKDGTASGSSEFGVYLNSPLTATYPATAMDGSFTIPTDQSSADKLHAADLMSGETTPTEARQSVGFKLDRHLAKVVITINEYVGYNSLPTITDVKITSMGSAMSLSDGKWTASNTTATEIAALITNDESGKGMHTYTALVAPGEYGTEQNFLTLTDTQSGESKGGTKTVKLPASVKFVAGKSYAYTLKVENDKLTLSADITWKTNEKYVTSQASTLSDFYKTDLTKAEVGDYYLSDGNLYSYDTPAALITEDVQKNIVGIVYALASDAEGNDASTSDDAIYPYSQSGIGSNTIHGYVIALIDVGAWKKAGAIYTDDRYRQPSVWSTETVDIPNIDKEGIEDQGDIQYKHLTTSWSGYKNTQAVFAYAKENSKDLKSKYPAFNYIKSYNDSVQAPAKSSGWYMASAVQMRRAMNSDAVVKINLERAGGLYFYQVYDYWTSCQYWSNGYQNVINVVDNYTYKVRQKDSDDYFNRAFLTF